jgi:hypothetical protein
MRPDDPTYIHAFLDAYADASLNTCLLSYLYALERAADADPLTQRAAHCELPLFFYLIHTRYPSIHPNLN